MKNMKNKQSYQVISANFRVSIPTFALLFLAPLAGFGVNLTWKGDTASGDFNDAAEWTPAQAPTSADSVFFTATVPSTVTFAANGASVATRFRSGTFVVETGANTWTNTGVFYVGDSTAVANTTFNGGTYDNSGGGNIILGVSAGNDGNTLRFTNGATYTGAAAEIIGRAGASNSLEILSGSTFTAKGFNLGTLGGGNDNSLLVSGSGSTLNVSGVTALSIAASTTGNSLTVADGATANFNNAIATAARIRIGLGVNSDDTSATFTGAGTTVNTNADQIQLVNGGVLGNRLTVADGATLNATSATISNGESSAGSGNNAFTVTGGTANVADITVAHQNNVTVSGGTLNISGEFLSTTGGSDISFTGGTISAGSTAFALIDGFTVGDGSDATIAIYHLNGGTHEVSGTGITLASDGVLSGTGTVTVGNVTTSASSVLSPGNSIGTLTIGTTLDTSAGAIFNIELGAGFTSDLLDLGTWEATGAAADSLVFNFIDLGGAVEGTYTLATFDDGNGLELGQFAEGSTLAGLSGSFILNANSLEYSLIPEPLSAGVLGMSVLGMALFARRRTRAT